MNIILSLTSEQLRRAADIKEKIVALGKELTSIVSSIVTVTPPQKKKFKMSAAAKAKISAAAKARWAKVKGTKPAAKPVAKGGKRKGMSAAAKAKISAAAKARWAKIKAAGKKKL
jgi:hypothetical protein